MEVYSLLATCEESLDIIEFIEGVNGGELIEVEPYNLLSHLAEERIVKLEKAQLYWPILYLLFGEAWFGRSLAPSTLLVALSCRLL